MTRLIKDIVKEYRDVRDTYLAASKEFNRIEKESKEAMLTLESEMLALANELGVESFRTEYGTTFKTKKTYARLGAGPDSKKAREDYALRTGDFGLFTGHVNKTHAKELLDDGVNLTEVGIDWIEEYTMGFRKS